MKMVAAVLACYAFDKAGGKLIDNHVMWRGQVKNRMERTRRRTRPASTLRIHGKISSAWRPTRPFIGQQAQQ